MSTATPTRFTTADLDLLPDVRGWRYEIIDGELHVSKSTDWRHSFAGDAILFALKGWSLESATGVPLTAPGLVFADDDNVIPDVIWISTERVARGVDAAGHFTLAPELVVEVLSPGAGNERRDRELKLDLYSRRGVEEYWLVDWQRRLVDVFRRLDGTLQHALTLIGSDSLTSSLLPGFTCPLPSLWAPYL